MPVGLSFLSWSVLSVALFEQVNINSFASISKLLYSCGIFFAIFESWVLLSSLRHEFSISSERVTVTRFPPKNELKVPSGL